MLILTSVMCALAIYCYVETSANASSFEGLTQNVEALAQTEPGGDRIICRCKTGFLSNNKCLVSNPDKICAQSEPGGNIDCSSYHGNC